MPKNANRDPVVNTHWDLDFPPRDWKARRRPRKGVEEQSVKQAASAGEAMMAERTSSVGDRPPPDEALRIARRRLWAADSACYYSHRRYAQSLSEADRLDWVRHQTERDAAEKELAEAEQALAQTDKT